MKAKYLLALAALGGVATSANAAVTISAVPGSPPYAGPFTYDFDPDGAGLVSGGQITNGFISGEEAQPFGSTGDYWTVGPTDGSPARLDLSSWAAIGSISFLWGSVDSFNSLQVIAKDGVTALGPLFTGANVALPPNGDQDDLATNPIVTLTFSGADQTDVGWLELASSSNAFETDNYVITAVPEPGTWLLMLLGFGLVGGALRASKKREAGPRVRYAF